MNLFRKFTPPSKPVTDREHVMSERGTTAITLADEILTTPEVMKSNEKRYRGGTFAAAELEPIEAAS